MIIKKQQTDSELRLDLVSGDWVVVATSRARRPEAFAKDKRVIEEISPDKCPFCKSEILKKAILRHGNVIVIPNDFPAFSYGDDLNRRSEGPNQIMNGVGFHEVIITLDHKRQMSQFAKNEIKEVLDVYQMRYKELINKKFIKYVSIFHNHGKEAGASLTHPHSQLIAIPVTDPDLRSSINGAESYYKEYERCVYCTMIEWDLKDGRRIIYENEKFVVLCPFAPQISFEVRIYPKEHEACFETIDEKEKDLFSDALQIALSKIYKGLNDPAYNFYIHTSPADYHNHKYYHWHLAVMPKTSTYAGFELSTGIEISTIEPEMAAEFLKAIN